MKIKLLTATSVVIAAAAAFGCQRTAEGTEYTAPPVSTLAVVWKQTAAEYEALYLQGFALAFIGPLVDEEAHPHFAFILPLDPDSGRSLAGFAVRSGSLRATRAVLPNQGADPELRLTRVNSSQAELRWNAARYPMVLMRDLATGAVVSLARGGAVRVPAVGASNFGLTFSDGVHSVTRQGRLLQ